MLRILSCIVYEHNPVFLLLAVVTLILGSVVTMRLFARVRRTEKDIRRLWLILAGLIGGGTIWSTHFVAMLAYESNLILGYDPVLTIVSLFIVIATTSVGFFVASLTHRAYLVEVGGLILGLGISLMHYTGMMAIHLSGVYEWDATFVVLSVIFGGAFGALATNRIARPLSRFYRQSGALAFCLAVGLMHFTGMSGFSLTPLNLELTVTELISEEILGTGVVIVMALLFLTTFITSTIDLKNAEATTEHYRHLALHDPLTGVANRLGCEQYLTNILSVKVDSETNVGVLSIDLDRFKNINDVHGHAAGDHLLRTISQRITDILQQGEVFGRFGGDEFIAVKSNVILEREAFEFGNRILESVRQPVFWQEVVFETSASIGFSLFPRDGVKPVELMEKADLAMYRAKTQGRNCVAGYDMKMDTANKERTALAMDLARALEKGQLEVYYQLQNDTSTRNVSGVEALLRWHHPVRGTVLPDVFIPIAEETGSITALGNWVLHQACKDACDWPLPVNVAVNVAPKQICDLDFPSVVHETLLKTGLSPARLELEITESGIISDTTQTLHVIRQLKNLGVKIAMDDYGTGYSSLSTLQNYPFDKIKIDQEFVKEIHVNKHSSAIVRSTVILGNSLDIPVLAEGVETEDHLKFLSDEGCQQVQGFLFGKPMSNADLLVKLSKQLDHKSVADRSDEELESVRRVS